MCFAPFMHSSQLSCASSLTSTLPKTSLGIEKFFEMTAPTAMGMDPALDSGLIVIAKRNGWRKPVAEESVQKELVDSEKVGGSVHMQPLMSVDQSLESNHSGLLFAGSTTLKTVASKSDKWQLHIAAGNVLCARSHSSEPFHLSIRSFQDGKVNRYGLRNGDSVKVQHGDVVFMDFGGQFAPFISGEFYSTGLSETERFECIKSFCYAATHFVLDFVAIVENDGHGEPKGSETIVEEMDGSNGEKHGSERQGLASSSRVGSES